MALKSILLKSVDIMNLYPLFNGYTKNTATVFMLHSIAPAGERRDGAISQDTLASHFEFLRRKKYQVLSLKEYIRALIEHKNTYKSVVFTVDDGYRDFYQNAFEIFKSFGFPATIFITSDFIDKGLFFWWDKLEFAFRTTSVEEIDLSSIGMGKTHLDSPQKRTQIVQAVTRFCKKLPNSEKLDLIARLVKVMNVDISHQPRGIYEPLKWEEIREMKESGIDFQPHTKTHPILSRIPREQKLIELTEPKRLIEERLGISADIFCYPNGQAEDFDDETISILKSAGYSAAVMGVDGFDSTKSSVDLFRLKRFAIPDDTPRFRQYVSGLEMFKRKLL